MKRKYNIGLLDGVFLSVEDRKLVLQATTPIEAVQAQQNPECLEKEASLWRPWQHRIHSVRTSKECAV